MRTSKSPEQPQLLHTDFGSCQSPSYTLILPVYPNLLQQYLTYKRILWNYISPNFTAAARLIFVPEAPGDLVATKAPTFCKRCRDKLSLNSSCCLKKKKLGEKKRVFLLDGFIFFLKHTKTTSVFSPEKQVCV